MLFKPAQLTPYDPVLSSQFFDDFLGPVTQTNSTDETPVSTNFNRIISGGANVGWTFPTLANKNTGVINSQLVGVGTVTGLYSGNQPVLSQLGALFVEWRLQVNQLSTGVDEYQLYVGHGEKAGLLVNGFGFEYDRAAFGVNWQCISTKLGAVTRVNSGVPVPLNQYQKFRVAVDPQALAVTYSIDGVVVATISAAITQNPIGPVVRSVKTVGGGTANSFSADYCNFQQVYNSSR